MEEKRSKEFVVEYFNKLIEKEQIAIYNESRGTIILRNGFIFQVSNMFNFFRDSWFAYNKAQMEQDEKKKCFLLELSNNGVITNGQISVDLNNVAVMIGENRESQVELPMFEEDEIPMDDIGFENGDSTLDIFSSN